MLHQVTQVFHAFCNDFRRCIQMDLAVIGPKGKDYQVQRLVALKGNGKRLDPAASRFQGSSQTVVRPPIPSSIT